MTAESVATRFDVPGRLVAVEPIGSGNVNDTWCVIMRTTFSEERFILQRINRAVFRDPAAVMSNIRIVTEHAHRRIWEEAESADRIWQLPRVIPTREGCDFVQDEDGEFWRALSLIASANQHERISRPEHATEAGRVLGHFHRIVSDLPTDGLVDTLPGFHITPNYLRIFDDRCRSREARERIGASVEATRLVEMIETRREFVTILEDARESGELSPRPIHGDPKITNVMIDSLTGKGTAIVDLDTVKPGLIHYDFGDAVRSGCNPAGEETTNLDEVFLDLALFESFVRGYRIEAGPFLSDADERYLYDSIRLIAFELGLRFFTDHLSGDVYFKTSHEGQNLNRARVQFALCESIEAKEEEMKRILKGVATD